MNAPSDADATGIPDPTVCRAFDLDKRGVKLSDAANRVHSE
jgi:hypothetical protein